MKGKSRGGVESRMAIKEGKAKTRSGLQSLRVSLGTGSKIGTEITFRKATV